MHIIRKVTFASDLHFKVAEPLGLNVSGSNSRTEKKLSLLETFLGRSVEEEAEMAIIGGDLFDTPNPPAFLRIKVADVISKYLDVLSIVVFPGNHDDSSTFSAWESEGLLTSQTCLEQAGFHYVSEMETMKLFDEDLLAYFVPYRDSHLIEGIPEGSVVFSHFYVAGSVISTSNLSLGLKGGGIVGADLAKFRKVFLGDVHIGQQVGENIHYPGSLAKINIDDNELDTGFFVITGDKNSIQVEKQRVYDWDFNRIIIDESVDVDSLPECLGQVVEVTLKGSRVFVESVSLPILRSKFEGKKLIVKRDIEDEGDLKMKFNTIKIDAGLSLPRRWQIFGEERGVDPEAIKLVIDSFNEASNV